MTMEYVLLLALSGLILMPALLKYPNQGFSKGSTRLGARIETQLATGSGFNPYPGGGDDKKVLWVEKE